MTFRKQLLSSSAKFTIGNGFETALEDAVNHSRCDDGSRVQARAWLTFHEIIAFGQDNYYQSVNWPQCTPRAPCSLSFGFARFAVCLLSFLSDPASNDTPSCDRRIIGST